MQSFGVDAMGALPNLIGQNQLHLVGTFAPLTTGVLVGYRAWLSALSGAAQSCKFGMFTNKAGPYPDAFVAGSESVPQSVPTSGMTKYLVPSTGSPTVTAGVSYWLGILTDAADTTLNIAYDAGADLKYGTQTYASGFPDPLPAGYSDIAFQYSIAALYNDGSVVLGMPEKTHPRFGPF